MLIHAGLPAYTPFFHGDKSEGSELRPVAAAPLENQSGDLKSVTEAEASASTSLQERQSSQALTSPQASSPQATPSESVQADKARLEAEKVEKQAQRQQEMVEQKQIQALSSRDSEVRAHEQAHAAVGGQYAGAPTYQFQRGPDGVNYAVGGEVSISTSAISGDPRATIEKARIIKQAALAPAEPSPQDRRVAASAAQMEAQAMADLVAMEQEQRVATEQSLSGGEEEVQEEEKDEEAYELPLSNPKEKQEPPKPLISNEQELFNRLSAALNNRLVGSQIESQAPRPGDFISQFA